MHTRMADWLTTPEEVPLLPPFATSFAKAAVGGSDDDDDDDGDDDDSDDDDDDGDDDDPDAEKSDEELRAELKAIRASLEKANGQSAARRRKLREREAELEAERRKPKAKPAAKKDEAETPDVDAIREEAKREAKLEADNRIKRSEAKAALVAAGVSRDVAADLIGFVKLDELDVEGEEVEGLDEEIERIQAKYPSFFTKGRRRRESVAGEGDRDGKAPRRTKMTASEAQAARITGH